MIALAGTVWGNPRTSHLYAIFKGEYIYFGETGHVPPVRWKSHLTSQTDFLGKLQDTDATEAAAATPVFFVGIHISCADSEPEPKQKIARRAIEAELHKKFELDPSPMAPASTLLSTPPPSPVRHAFSFDKGLVAEQVYQLIADEFRKWRNGRSPPNTGTSNESTTGEYGGHI
ncbi:hypothetical protein [Delftia acidovorans]|uniref:hypothetical protein n=1 Tax=Delftia acidovorans TaxID=80866 RepID=UPI0011CD6F6F|nr:hypothetical protein [Delftia acidovorans]